MGHISRPIIVLASQNREHGRVDRGIGTGECLADSHVYAGVQTTGYVDAT